MYQQDSSTQGKSVTKVYLKMFKPNFQLKSTEQGFPECERQKIKSRDHTPARHEGELHVQHTKLRATLSPSKPGSALQESQFGESHCCHTATTYLQIMSVPLAIARTCGSPAVLWCAFPWPLHFDRHSFNDSCTRGSILW